MLGLIERSWAFEPDLLDPRPDEVTIQKVGGREKAMSIF